MTGGSSLPNAALLEAGICRDCMKWGSDLLLAALLIERAKPSVAPRIQVRGALFHAAGIADVEPAEVLAGRRWKRLVRLRHAVVETVLRHARSAGYEQSLPTIGKAMGGRDHSTVINSRERARALVARDPEFAWFVERVWAAAECEPFGPGHAAKAEVMAEPLDVPVPVLCAEPGEMDDGEGDEPREISAMERCSRNLLAALLAHHPERVQPVRGLGPRRETVRSGYAALGAA